MYGLKILNDSGDIIVDGESPMIQLHYEATINLSAVPVDSTSLPENYSTEISFPGISERPIVCCSVTEVSGGTAYIQTGDVIYYPYKSSTLWDRVKIVPNLADKSQTVKVFIFTQKISTNELDYGLAVYNSNGDLVFDGSRQMVREHKIFSGILPVQDNSITTLSFDDLGYIPPVTFISKGGGISHTFPDFPWAVWTGLSYKVASNNITIQNITKFAWGLAVDDWYTAPQTYDANYEIIVYKYK